MRDASETGSKDEYLIARSAQPNAIAYDPVHQVSIRIIL